MNVDVVSIATTTNSVATGISVIRMCRRVWPTF